MSEREQAPTPSADGYRQAVLNDPFLAAFDEALQSTVKDLNERMQQHDRRMQQNTSSLRHAR